MLSHGEYCSPDHAAALVLYQRVAAATEGPELVRGTANYNCGVSFEKGEGCEVNLETAVAHYRRAWELGRKEAAAFVAQMVLIDERPGINLARHTRPALDMMEAASASEPTAIYVCSMLFQQSKHGYPKDDARAFQLRKQAAAGGSRAALQSLALAYFLGNSGAPLDLPQAIACQRAACAQVPDDVELQVKLCVFLTDEDASLDDASEGLQSLLMLSSGGHTAAMVHLGRLHRLGRHVPRDIAAAHRWLTGAAQLGDSEACLRLGDLLYHEEDPQYRNRDAAAAWYKRAADSGDSDGMYKYAKCLYFGHGAPADRPAAVECFKRAAEAGSAKGMYELADSLERGDGCAKDTTAAAKWYQRAIDEDQHAESMYCLANLCYSGDGVPQDRVRGEQLLRASAEAGYVTAMRKLGNALYNGRGMPKDRNEAAKWYRRGTEAGDVDCMVRYGLCCYFGHGIASPDKDQAALLFRQAAEAGSKDGMYELADCCERGDGGPKDPESALRWFTSASELGHAQAAYRVGLLHFRGKGVPQDRELALALWRDAAERGCADAAYQLGRTLAPEGDSPSGDNDMVFRLYKQAADAGHVDAKCSLGIAYANGTGCARDTAAAKKWLREAVAVGNVHAMFALGCLLLNRLGQPGSREEARALLERAAEKGSEPAAAKLAQMTTPALLAPAPALVLVSSTSLSGAASGQGGQGKRPREAALSSDDGVGARKAQRGASDGDGPGGSDSGGGNDEVSGHVDSAFVTLMLKASGGDPEASFQMGQRCSTGDGIAINRQQAARWYRGAAEGGHVGAMHALAACFRLGIGLPVDAAQSKLWDEKASNAK